jgi:hypothetical protein
MVDNRNKYMVQTLQHRDTQVHTRSCHHMFFFGVSFLQTSLFLGVVRTSTTWTSSMVSSTTCIVSCYNTWRSMAWSTTYSGSCCTIWRSMASSTICIGSCYTIWRSMDSCCGTCLSSTSSSTGNHCLLFDFLFLHSKHIDYISPYFYKYVIVLVTRILYFLCSIEVAF